MKNVRIAEKNIIDVLYEAIVGLLVVFLVLPFSILFFYYLFYLLEDYSSIKNNFLKFNMYDARLLESFSGIIPYSLLSYRFNQPYTGGRFFSCYVNFFEKISELNEEKIRKFYLNEVNLEDLNIAYPKWENPERCIGEAIYYPINEVKEKWKAPGLTYIRQMKSYDTKFDLLVKGSTARIELSTYTAKDTRIFITEYPKENAYRALVWYPNKNVVKMITACAGFTDFCGKR